MKPHQAVPFTSCVSCPVGNTSWGPFNDSGGGHRTWNVGDGSPEGREFFGFRTVIVVLLVPVPFD